MTVNICGVPHKIVECEDKFNVDVHFAVRDWGGKNDKRRKDKRDISRLRNNK